MKFPFSYQLLISKVKLVHLMFSMFNTREANASQSNQRGMVLSIEEKFPCILDINKCIYIHTHVLHIYDY